MLRCKESEKERNRAWQTVSISCHLPLMLPKSHCLQRPPVYANGALHLGIRAFSGHGGRAGRKWQLVEKHRSFRMPPWVVPVCFTQSLGRSPAGLCSRKYPSWGAHSLIHSPRAFHTFPSHKPSLSGASGIISKINYWYWYPCLEVYFGKNQN